MREWWHELAELIARRLAWRWQAVREGRTSSAPEQAKGEATISRTKGSDVKGEKDPPTR